MKLLIAIVQEEDLALLNEDLMDRDFRITKVSSTGGFLKSGNATLLIGVEDERMEEALEIIEENCKTRKTTTSMVNALSAESYIPLPVEVQIGGAVVFVLEVDRFIRI